MTESKKAKFKRLAELRGERILRDVQLLSNLSNRNNYEYTEADVKLIFSTIEEEMRLAKMRFQQNKKRGINL
jgi:hypothetical protein